MSIRQRTWKIVESAEAGDRMSGNFDIFILTLIFLNVIAVVLESVPALETRFAGGFAAFEVMSVAVFSLEYLVRLWSCVEDPRFAQPLWGRIRFLLRPLPLIDLLAILPFFLSFATVDLRFLRALRLLRLIRVVKAARYVAAMQLFGYVVRVKREELILTSGLMLVLLIVASAVMYFAESGAQPDKFSSIPASMWWAVATLTTVGYGDIYPLTVLGKTAAALISIVGIGFFALPTAIIGSGLVEAMQEQKSPQVCPHCGKALEGSEPAA